MVLDSVVDAARVREARALLDEGRDEPARITAYTEVEPADVAARVAGLRDAGADTVVVQGSGDRPDPRPLVDPLAAADLLDAPWAPVSGSSNSA